MSDEKSKKTEITKIITPETESSKTTDKEKTSAIDTSPIEVQVENSAEESINNETNDLKKIEETTEVETKVEDNIIVSEDIEKTSEVEIIDNSESDKDDESEDDESEEVNSSDDEAHEEEEVELKAQKDYHNLTPNELISELETLLKSRAIQSLKHDVDEITSEFNAQFQAELEHKKEEFLAAGGNIIDFHYSNP
ncbi:MAG: hypothetical protein ACI9HJ_002032, partial [Ulvibacter sp.]